MPYFYYGIDPYYIILVLPAILFSLIAQFAVKSTFSKFSKKQCMVSGAAAAERVLRANGVYDVKIERVSGNLTDHYDPKTNVIRLSDAVYNARSISAVGVAAHEAGHAVQYATNYAPIRMRSAILPVCQFGSQISWPLIFIGLIMNSQFMINIGLVLFASIAAFQLITLPVELNASNRAVDALSMGGIITQTEMHGVEKVLKAAAMTYVAALAVSLAQLLRLIIRFGGLRRDD